MLDSLFTVPFFAGLVMALLLPLVGNVLRLRDEWLAALGFAHLATAGVLLGVALHAAPFIGALVGALCGAGGKQAVGGRSNSAYGLMILAGWSCTLLIAANTVLGESLAHALIDGQLYFAGWRELGIGGVLLLVAIVALRWLTPRLIMARLIPELEVANQLPAWRWHLGFDVLVAATIAGGTATFGLMAGFALILVPPWIACLLAPSWRRAQWLAAGIGVVTYCLAFWWALVFDQPFGPVLGAVLVAGCGAASVFGRGSRGDSAGV